jgi:hypothetical protein
MEVIHVQGDWTTYTNTHVWFSLIRTTKSMEQKPSWKANKSSATQEIPNILRNLNAHYHIHKSPPISFNILHEYTKPHISIYDKLGAVPVFCNWLYLTSLTVGNDHLRHRMMGRKVPAMAWPWIKTQSSSQKHSHHAISDIPSSLMKIITAYITRQYALTCSYIRCNSF